MAGSKSIDRQNARQHVPLSEEYMPSYPIKQKIGKRKKSQTDHDDDKNVVDAKSSHKILKIGQELADEDEAEHQAEYLKAANPAFSITSRRVGAYPDKTVEAHDDDEDEEDEAQYDDTWEDEDEDGASGGEEVDPEDLAIFNKFNPQMDPADLLTRPSPSGGDGDDANGDGQGTDLTALILERIAEFEAKGETGAASAGQDAPLQPGGVSLPTKVVEVYEQVGMILSRYKSGKLPKPFKILPGVPQWDTLLDITRPDNWTPNACYEATKIFTSSRPAVAQAFFNDILLPTVRSDIQETKKLDVHLYKALKKALYKPAAFFKGILFPLVESGTCTLREAHIIGSVLARVSIPVLHSAAALHRLCEVAAEQMSADLEAGGATNIFVRTLLEKKYALPYRVLDALVFHFMRFKGVGVDGGHQDAMTGVAGGRAAMRDEKLPVLWHQCLLAFAQRYKNDITEDQREALLDLLLTKAHSKIGPEVRRELLEGRGRGIPVEANMDMGGDDTML